LPSLSPPSLHDALPIFLTSADDLVTPSSTASDAQEMLTKIITTPARVGLHINTDKTEVLQIYIKEQEDSFTCVNQNETTTNIKSDRKSTRLNSSHQIIS